MRKLKQILGWVIVIAVAVAVGGWLVSLFSDNKEQLVFNTVKAELMDMRKTISATGTVEPEELINVGAQVGGMITSFGVDVDGNNVDYRSKVTENMVLANIDDSLYVSEVRECEANREQALAAIETAKANITLSEAQLKLAEANWKRAQQLNPQNVIPQSDYDSALADYEVAKADIGVSKANLAQAEAQLAAAEATLIKAKQNLGYCVISSPVNGVIIDRRVNIGQTVNSSMSAPSLFLIAKDLKKMQVWVSVNEADVGEIKVGQKAEFTVDAFPNRTFFGEVLKIRLNATMSQNVVTYIAEIGTDNSDETLLPYLTANVEFILAERDNVLAVPNSALRFTPDAAMVPEEYLNFSLNEDERSVWVMRDGKICPVAVKTGLNDGVHSEIIAGNLKPGDEVITGVTVVKIEENNTQDNSGSPFL
ncbi:MAG: efflux RND transporter periplasmic adaptor subunit, partial [Victivallaceae bacterium]